MPNVIIATTMWGEVDHTVGVRREEELKRQYWKDMLANGCTTVRFEDSYDSAWRIVGDLIRKDTTQVLLSSEMVETHLRLNETQAGVTLNHELQRLIKELKEATRQLREQAQKQDDKLLVRKLNERKTEIQAEICQTEEQLRRLKIPFLRQIRLQF